MHKLLEEGLSSEHIDKNRLRRPRKFNNPADFDHGYFEANGLCQSNSLRAIFSFLLNMRPSSILLKGPLVAEHVLSKFWVPPMMINCSLVEKTPRLEDVPSQSITFPRKFVYLLNGTFRIRPRSGRSSDFVHCKLHQCCVRKQKSSWWKFVRLEFANLNRFAS